MPSYSNASNLANVQTGEIRKAGLGLWPFPAFNPYVKWCSMSKLKKWCSFGVVEIFEQDKFKILKILSNKSASYSPKCHSVYEFYKLFRGLFIVQIEGDKNHE